MPIIRVNHASPLTETQIEALMKELTDVYTSVTNSNPGAVHVLVEHVPADRWAVGGESLTARRSKTS
ncbi:MULTISPECIES: tautomerase family protein [Nocardiaceae]|uniref:tautomerase family protein n=1 Tax=Nocardiaceae TaxID=85025 RepID=UPI0009BEEACF|nr:MULTISPECIES: tautomerase family protein [Nocardiaceae]MDC3729203.1 tautomerase family protein [Rhodococcus sp. Rp3]USI92928.1 4-oxalocrotonate tautomerase family protein [Rhodococcus pyridinivorans]